MDGNPVAKELRRRVSSRTVVAGPIKAAGALFYSANTHRYLFLLRDGDKYHDTWGIVGGKVESGESIIDCLNREMVEELGFQPTTIKTIPVDLFISPDTRFEYHTFVCIVRDEFIPTLNEEHKGYCWTTLDGMPKPLHPGLFNSINMDELKAKFKNIDSTVWA